MNKQLSDRNLELKDTLDLKDNFFNQRHGQKKELINLRQDLTLQLIELRDNIAEKRHKERLEVLSEKFTLQQQRVNSKD